MALYQLHSSQAIILCPSREVSIPLDEGNKDYQEYLAWLAEGNTPDPASPPADTRPDILADFRARREVYLGRVMQMLEFEDPVTYPNLRDACKLYRQKLLDLPDQPSVTAAVDGTQIKTAILAEYQAAVMAALNLCPQALSLFQKVSK